jgi:hypothetical protein
VSFRGVAKLFCRPVTFAVDKLAKKLIWDRFVQLNARIIKELQMIHEISVEYQALTL